MTTTYPYGADVAQVVTRSHVQVFRAWASHPDIETIPLTVTAADVTFDEATAPRVQGSITIATEDLDELASWEGLLDPRKGVRVAIAAGYAWEDQEDVQEFVDLGLRRITVSRPEGTARLELASDEALVIDSSPAINAPVNESTAFAAVVKLVNQCISPQPEFALGGISGGATKIDSIQDRWQAIADIADRNGGRVYDDGTRLWHAEGTPQVKATPDVILTRGLDGTLTATDDVTDRETWHNYVALVYSWRDGNGVDRIIKATQLVVDGPWSTTGPAGRRILLDERELSTTQAEANEAARQLLLRQLTRSRAQTVQSVAMLWLRPGMTAQVDSLSSTLRLVSRVSFSFPAGIMTVTTRLPENPAASQLTTTTPVVVVTPPPAPTPVPDPEPVPVKRYTSSWVSNGAATYRGSGVKRTDLPGEAAFGYYGSTNGNQSSILLFTGANSTGGETGKTISQALTGATVISATLRVYSTHWWYNGGGFTRFGIYNGASLPATFAGATPLTKTATWAKNAWYSQVLGSTFLSALKNGARGLTLGPSSPQSDLHQYGKVSTTGSTTAVLQITYSK